MALPWGSVEKTIDRVSELQARLHKLASLDVLVGVPADKTPRASGTMNNATLAYIHNFGSPARNIPARPFLTQGVKKFLPEARSMLKQGANDALHGKGDVNKLYERIGMLARNAVVAEITEPSPSFIPLKLATIRARLRRTAAGRRQLRKVKKANETLSSADYKPLIDTGQLRASISYVVREAD
jgi:hypothetical protein